jgi:hypothetical protein
MTNLEFIDEREQLEPENEKRSPAVEYGESPYAGCVDCFEVFDRMINSMYGSAKYEH